MIITENIGFVGVGNMASAMIVGLQKQAFDMQQIMAYDIDQERLQASQEEFNIQTSQTLADLVEKCKILILAVKPRQIQAVFQQLPTQNIDLLISIVAGINTTQIRKYLGNHQTTVVRFMPNTSVTLGVGAIGVYTNDILKTSQTQFIEFLLNGLGMSVWVENEDQINAITALSGSGPAYYFYLIEAMTKQGVTLGLTPEDSYHLSVQTLKGAALMAEQAGDIDSCIQLRKQVTSPNGTTEAALNKLNALKVDKHFQAAMTTAYQRAIELSEPFV